MGRIVFFAKKKPLRRPGKGLVDGEIFSAQRRIEGFQTVVEIHIKRRQVLRHSCEFFEPAAGAEYDLAVFVSPARITE
jgi:hypothetical protein